MFSSFSPLVWLHLPYLLSIAALALRDQLKLRTVLMVSVAVSAFEDFTASSGPDVQSLFWNAVSLLINGVVIVKIVMDQVHVGLSDEEKRLYATFGLLKPGEFRTLLKLATWATADEEIEITRQGILPTHLYYVATGTLSIEKSGREITIDAGTFIGEIAFLHRRPASATVRIAAGGRYLHWPVAVLDRRIEGRQQLKHAIVRLISADMARKVARA